MKLTFAQKGTHPESQADPFVFTAHGQYYIVATGNEGVHLYRSKRLDRDWEYLGIAYSRAGRKSYWAPCVLEYEGKWYLYVSTMPEGSCSDHDEQIEVAVGEDPEKGFFYEKDLLPPFSIDPHVVKSGGALYIFYSVNDETASRPGTYIVVQRMSSPLELAGEPAPAVKPTLDEEIFCRDRFRKGQHWHTIEGAFYFRVGDDHYLMYSGNCYTSEYYFLGYAWAHTAENDLTRVPFRKMPAEDVYAPILAKNGAENGTGHNSVIEADGALWCVYHGRDAGDLPVKRDARICRLHAEGRSLIAERI